MERTQNRLLWTVMAIVLAVFTPLLVPATAAQQLPPGRRVLRNGDFCEDPKSPVYWVTRDSAGLASFSLLEPEAGSSSRVLSCEVRQTSARPWTLELRQSVAAALVKGETLYVSFEYNITPGYAFYCYWQRDFSPWPKYLSMRFSDPCGKWSTCSMKVRVPRNLGPRESSLTFHLAEAKGTLKLRNFQVLAFPAHVPDEAIPTNSTPAFGGDYYDKNWRAEAQARLQQVRMADLRVSVLRGDEPVEGAKVSIRQKSRDFSFGTQIALPLFSDDALQRETFARFKVLLEGNEDKLPAFRETVARPGLFDTVEFREGLTWRLAEAWGDPLAAEVLPGLCKGGLKIRGHALYCPTFRFAPPACRQMGKEDLLKALHAHVSGAVTTYKGKIAEWDVVHAPLTYEEVYNVAGEESLVDAFKLAEQAAPEARLVFSEDRALTDTLTDRLDEMLALVQWLRNSGARIDAIALGALLRPPHIAPQEVEARLDRIATATRLPIIIRAFAVEADKEQVQAERLESLLLAFHSHPAVRRVVLAGIWDVTAPFGNSGLYRTNFAIKPAGTVLRTLLTETWWTKQDTQTGPDGTATVKGYHGHYEVVAELDGRRVSQAVPLSAGGASVELVLPAE